MPIHIDPTLRETPHDQVRVRLLVRSPDLERLDTALPAVVRAIGDLGPHSVSGPIRVPGGRLVTVDLGNLHPQDRARMPGVVAVALSDHGIDHATLEAAPLLGDHHLHLDRLAPLVRTWLHDPRPVGAPRYTARPSTALVETALAWLQDAPDDGDQGHDQLVAIVRSIEIPLPRTDLLRIVDDLLASPGDAPTGAVILLRTDFAQHARAAELGALNGYGIMLTSGQRDEPSNAVAKQMLRQRDLIRRFPGPLEWAAVMVDHTAVTGRFLASPHQRIGPDHPPTPLWYQVLSPAQLELLGRAPNGAVARPDGTSELTIGEPQHWMVGHPEHDDLVRRARELLSPPRHRGVRIGRRLTRAAARNRALAVALRAERSAPGEPGEPGEPDEPEAALRAAITGLRTTDPPPRYVSDPLPGLDGPMFIIDVGDLPPTARRELPDQLRAAIEAAGVTNADLDTPPEARAEPYLQLARFRPAVRAWLWAHEPVAPPPPHRRSSLVDAALGWLRDQHEPGDRLVALVESVEVPLNWDDRHTTVASVIDALLHTHTPHDQPTWTPLIQTDFETHAAYLDIGFASGHGLLLSASAASWSEADQAAQMRTLRHLVDREAADLDHAGIALDPVEHHFVLPHAALHSQLERTSLWYRLLSTTQDQQFGDELPDEAARRPDGRLELTIGEPRQWAPGHPDRDRLQAHARNLLDR